MKECIFCKEIFDSESERTKHIKNCVPKFIGKEFRVYFVIRPIGVFELKKIDGQYLYGKFNEIENAIFDIEDTNYCFSFKGSNKELLQIIK